MATPHLTKRFRSIPRVLYLIGGFCVLISCQTTTKVTMLELELETNSDVHSDKAIKQAPSLTQIMAPVDSDLIESFDNLWARLQTKFLLTDYYDNPAVHGALGAYINNQPYFDRIVERAEPFLFWIVGEIERRNLPMELALIPIVESTFNPNAYSPKHAVGLWQFIGPTAKSFGLQQDWWYDGRRDPRASTVAALDFLEQLHLEFDNNWLLALAAYNTGPGNVNRAIRRANVTTETADFWSLPLAKETKAHVPKILALAKLISNSSRYGIELAPIANEEPLILVKIDSQIDLAQAAQLAKLDYNELRRLNPGYLQWATHPDNPQVIAVPIDKAKLLRDRIAELGPDQFITWDRYEIKPGDTLSAIAIKLNTNVQVLTSVNQIKENKIIAGDSLLVPRTTDFSLLANINKNNQVRRRLPVPNIYIVRPGDNLWTIARRFDLKSRDIANRNKIDINSILQPGQELQLEILNNDLPSKTISATVPAEEYEVRRGDAMIEIAARFGISLVDLLRWNNLSSSDLIFPGQLIRVIQPQIH